jgi:hypothetical protein
MMKTQQVHIKKSTDLVAGLEKLKKLSPHLVTVFGGIDEFTSGHVKQIAQAFPKATVIGCSTAGEISSNGVFDGTVVVTGCHFDKDPGLASAIETIRDMSDSFNCGKRLAEKLKSSLKADVPKSIFVLGRGLEINGSDVINGVRSVFGDKVVITGGLAGDAGRFKQTFTLLNDKVMDNAVAAFVVAGPYIEVSFGSMGGWEPFGPVRKVTKAQGNILVELDGQPALDIYKKYLGDKAKDLPASGLLYPFAILKDNQDNTGLIRTILGIDEIKKTLTLAGDIPQGGLVRLMHSSNDGLVSGAKGAAELTLKNSPAHSEEGLGILISCVGRKIVMGNDIEDELDAVREVLGENTVTGFYSYGEICPQQGFMECKLHNQTMTITYLYEKKAA